MVHPLFSGTYVYAPGSGHGADVGLGAAAFAQTNGVSGDAVHPDDMRERRGCLLLAGLGNKHAAAALHGAGVRALPPCIETKCFSVTKHPSLFEPRHRGGGGTHAVRLPERAARGNERSANLPAVHGTAESRHRKFTGNCLRAGGCAVAEMAAARISGGTRVARCQPHPRYLHRVHHLHHAARPGDGAG